MATLCHFKQANVKFCKINFVKCPVKVAFIVTKKLKLTLLQKKLMSTNNKSLAVKINDGI